MQLLVVMKFNEKLNLIFKTLGCKNANIARVSNLDASLISRFRTGSRIPKSNSSQLIKLCKGISNYANENGKTEEIIEVCQLPENLSQDIFHEILLAWLTTSDTDVTSSTKSLQNEFLPGYFKNFSSKLNAIMNLLEISNVCMSKSLDIDASLVSRFRNGSRTPSPRNSITKQICGYLLDRAIGQKQLAGFCELIGQNAAFADNEYDKILDYFIDWISDKKEITEQFAVSNFYNKVNSYTFVREYKTASITNLVGEQILSNTASMYIGVDGFKKAFLRFLASVCNCATPQTIYMYSDQKKDWLTNDPEYMKKVMTLMYILLEKKNRIKVIHTVERNLPDVFRTIEEWFPLYSSGRIQSYSHKKSYDGRFEHTLFVAPNLAAIHASYATGTEMHADYHYVEGDRVNYHMDQFNALMDESFPLVDVCPEEMEEEFGVENDFANDEEKGEILALIPSLPLNTISEKLFLDILDTNNIPDEEKEELLKVFKVRGQRMQEAVKCNTITEFIPIIDCSKLPSKEELKTKSYDELKRVDNYNLVPVSISTNPDKSNIYYSKEEYIEHLNALKNEIASNSNRLVYLIPYAPFSSINTAVRKNKSATTFKTCINSPRMHFVYSEHSLVVYAYEEYINSLKTKALNKSTNVEDVLEVINKYIEK